MSNLHPNPGWENHYMQEISTLNTPIGTNILGKHCILELYECDKNKLNDESSIRYIISLGVKLSGATLLNLISHRFEPQGVTGLALLAESHISIHTWPESGYAAVDVFTCGDHTMPEKACEVIYKELAAKSLSFNIVKRQTPESIGNQIREPNSIKDIKNL